VTYDIGQSKDSTRTSCRRI